MNLSEKINEELKNAMKAKDKEKLSVIRMLKSAITLAKIDLKHDPSDEEVLDIIAKQIKLRKDSIEEFTKANRTDLVNQYQGEIDILKEYLPEQLTIEEINTMIDEIFDKIKPESIKQMGLVMKELAPKISGRFDKGEASQIVKERLNNL
ncbi:MAG: GatB/YqeY domain-containing protein [Bacilli bacterium]|nr:GatB/YqeY domain-containing protein [Bacilli bacterium]